MGNIAKKRKLLALAAAILAAIAYRNPGLIKNETPGITTLGAIEWYNGIIFGSFLGSQASIEGAAAIRGNLIVDHGAFRFDIGAASLATPGSHTVLIGSRLVNINRYPVLLLGGEIGGSGTNANIYGGGVVMKQPYRQAYVNGSFQFNIANGSAPSYIKAEDIEGFFIQSKQALTNLSFMLPTVNNTKIPAENTDFTQWNLKDFEHQDLNTGLSMLSFNLYGADQVSIGDIQFSREMLEYDVIALNFDADTVLFSGGRIWVDGVPVNTSAPRSSGENDLLAAVAEKVVFNFPNATKIQICQYGVAGSMIAVRAELSLEASCINGQIFAGSLIQQEGGGLRSFNLKGLEALLEITPGK